MDTIHCEIRLKLFASLILVFCGCSQNKKWIVDNWEVSAKKEIQKCSTEWKRRKGLEMEQFANEKKLKETIQDDFLRSKKIYVSEIRSLEHSSFVVLVKTVEDTVVYSFEYNKDTDRFEKSIVESSPYGEDYYLNLFNSFEQYFLCDMSNSDSELHLILENK